MGKNVLNKDKYFDEASVKYIAVIDLIREVITSSNNWTLGQ